MKKGVRIGIYITSFVFTVLLLVLFDLIVEKKTDLEDAIAFASILTIADLIGVKKYIENKSGKKFTKKDNINHFITIIIIMIISLLGYFTIKSVYEVNKEPKITILEMSIKKSLIDIAQEKYSNNDDFTYAEEHKVLDYEIKDDEIYVYLVANYGILSQNNCEFLNNTQNVLTIIYNKNKNNKGIYELKEYKENYLPDKLKDKTNVNYEDDYFKNQLKNYCNK